MSNVSPLVLVVEDEDVIRQITCQAISAGQYRVIEAATGKQALDEVATRHPDAILLDLGLPDMSGIDVIRQVSHLRSLPVVVFSANALEHDKIEALEAGAVDFVDKPFMVVDLLSRLRSAIRRSARSRVDAPSTWRFGELLVDLQSHRVTVCNHEIDLTADEFRLLNAFVRNAGRLLTYRSLRHEISGLNAAPEIAALVALVGQLRHKLELDPVRPRHFVAEMGIGYRFRDE